VFTRIGVASCVTACLVVSPATAAASFPGRAGTLAADGGALSGRGVLVSKRLGHRQSQRGFPVGYIGGSPDGRHIAISTETGLYLYRPDGSERRRITTKGIKPVVQLGHVSFDPTGRRIVFEGRTSGRRPPPLYAIRIDGTGFRKLGVSGYSPEWSPDGESIAFVRSQPHGIISEWGDLYRMSATGRDVRLLYRPPSTNAAVRSFDWSPDSRQLVVNIQDNGQDCEGALPGTPCAEPPAEELVMTIIDRRGRLVRRLVPGTYPVWSPDGREIAYGVPLRTTVAISALPAAGGRPRRLFTVPDALSSLAWLRRP